MSGGLAIVVFVVGVIASIMVHEWGHYATARRFGMRADRFFLGFGPTLWSTRRGETEFGVKALPLGGFVRIKGMTPLDERLQPVVDTVLDPERLAEQRREQAARDQVDVLEAPAVPAAVTDHLAEVLAERGTPREVRGRLVERFRSNLSPDATPAEARTLLTQLIASEVPDTGRVGDLHHRLTRGDEGRFFADRPAWQRAIVLASGSALHWIQAIVLLFVGFLLFGTTVAVPVVDGFVEGQVTPAQTAGLEVGDRIVSVAGVPTDDFTEQRDLIRERPGESVALVVDRGGEVVNLTVVPEPTTDPETGETVGVVGFFPRIEDRPLPADEALYQTFVGPGSFTSMSVETVRALGRVFGPEGIGALVSQLSGDQERAVDGGISMVGAASAAGQGTNAFGPLFLFVLLASVNVFVGIFNILPLPPLDGGHLAVLGIERSVNGVRSRLGRPADFSIDPRAVAAVAIPVIALVATISVGLLWLDITKPIRIE
jgi:regulator of sigma E protease